MVEKKDVPGERTVMIVIVVITGMSPRIRLGRIFFLRICWRL